MEVIQLGNALGAEICGIDIAKAPSDAEIDTFLV